MLASAESLKVGSRVLLRQQAGGRVVRHAEVIAVRGGQKPYRLRYFLPDGQERGVWEGLPLEVDEFVGGAQMTPKIARPAPQPLPSEIQILILRGAVSDYTNQISALQALLKEATDELARLESTGGA